MEILILVVVAVVIGGLIYINHNRKAIDTNQDGKVDAAEVKAAVQTEMKEVAKKATAKAKAVKEKVATAKKTAKK
jgi:hypothetical protein